MFDRVVVQQGRTEHVPYEKTIHVHKPSTAQDLKALAELRDEAIKSVVGNVVNTDMSMQVTVAERPDKFDFAMYIKVKLNGKEVEGIIPLFERGQPIDSPGDLVGGKIRAWLLDQLMGMITPESFHMSKGVYDAIRTNCRTR